MSRVLLRTGSGYHGAGRTRRAMARPGGYSLITVLLAPGKRVGSIRAAGQVATVWVPWAVDPASASGLAAPLARRNRNWNSGQ
jgi:hypothetical protein